MGANTVDSSAAEKASAASAAVQAAVGPYATPLHTLAGTRGLWVEHHTHHCTLGVMVQAVEGPLQGEHGRDDLMSACPGPRATHKQHAVYAIWLTCMKQEAGKAITLLCLAAVLSSQTEGPKHVGTSFWA